MRPAAVERHKQRRRAAIPSLQLLAHVSQLRGGQQHQVECLGHARRKPQVGLPFQQGRQLHEHPRGTQVRAQLPHDQRASTLQQARAGWTAKPPENLLQHLLKVGRLVGHRGKDRHGLQDHAVVRGTEGIEQGRQEGGQGGEHLWVGF